MIQADKTNKEFKELIPTTTFTLTVQFFSFLCFVLLPALYSQMLHFAVTMENKTVFSTLFTYPLLLLV